jgi:hypothetical protein
MLKALSRKIKYQALVVLLLVAFTSNASYGVTIHTSDFISSNQRTNFNSFELIDHRWYEPFVRDSLTYTENGITVSQINSTAQLWVSPPGVFDGEHAWYPSGGDNGYTSISLADGSDFGNVGMYVSSGWTRAELILYELWNDGSLLLSGSVPTKTLSYSPVFHYLGFEGGGFDIIYLRDIWTSETLVAGTFYDGTTNTLMVDAIEVAQVPSPAPILGAFAAIVWSRRIRRHMKLHNANLIQSILRP